MNFAIPDLPLARCKNYRFPDRFYQPVDHAFRNRGIRAMCDACPERIPCLQWALDNREIGIWGATTDHERSLLRRLGKRWAA